MLKGLRLIVFSASKKRHLQALQRGMGQKHLTA